MAAMAPALTDAAAEPHHIRFKLAPSSSTLSPGSVENNSNAGNILIPSNGTVKRKDSEECSLDFRDGGTEEPPPAELGKLQPLVASYLCSDVTSVPSSKESLKLQGVLIKQSVLKSHGILPGSYFGGSDFLSRKHQTLDLAGERLKSLRSAGGQPVANGLAKKLAKTCANKDHVSLVNGGRPTTNQDSPTQTQDVSKGELSSHVSSREPTGISCAAVNVGECLSPKIPGGQPVSEAPCPVGSAMDRDSEGNGGMTPTSREMFSPFSSLETEARERTLLSQSRQGEIEGRLQRLRKRLQVVQVKQVERHVQQQLSGFLHTSFSKLPSLDSLRQRSPAVLTRKAEADLWRAARDPGAEDGLGHFLKSGSVPGELERLSLSGTTNLRSAEAAFDSDATESSSGGETDVEEDELAKADIEQRHVSLWRRAEGRYALERASIISHWNWLQAHISDLEYRIRQQTDIYRQIRANKVLIELGDSAPCEALSEEGSEVKAEAVARHVKDGGSERSEHAGSPHSSCSEAGVWKASGPGRPVNGMVHSMHPSLLDCTSSESLGPDEQTGRKQCLGPLSLPSDSSCTAARTRPVLGCKRRRLVRPAAVTNLSHKVQRIPGPRCGCEVNPVCTTCVGRAVPSMDLPYEHPLLERLSLLDPSVHPTLSFRDDVSVGLNFQQVMKLQLYSKPLEKIKPLKKMSLKHKLSLSGRLHAARSSSRDKHKLTNSLLTGLRLSHHKTRPERLHHQQFEGRSIYKGERGQGLMLGSYDRGHSYRSPREHFPEKIDASPMVYMDVTSPCSPLAGLHTSSHGPLVRQLSTSSESSTPVGSGCQSATSTPQPIRRRRGESSFDINNIVIPMSVAATTRVEKLQYKEILTPSWRKVDIFTKPVSEEDETVEIEDLSDAAFTQLHLPCEEHERSRWTWMASSSAMRRGSRLYKSLDGRTTPSLSGTNPSTPQPASPDMTHFQLLQDYGPVASPRSPASPDLPPCARDTQRLHSEELRCSTPDFTCDELPVQPWEKRTFPLEQDVTPEPAARRSLEGEPWGRVTRRLSGSRGACVQTEPESGVILPAPSSAQ